MGIEELDLINCVSSDNTNAIEKNLASVVEAAINNIVKQLSATAQSNGLVTVSLVPVNYGWHFDDFIETDCDGESINVNFDIIDAIKRYYFDHSTGEVNMSAEEKNDLIELANSIKSLAETCK